MVFTNPEGRIAAERMEYDWTTGSGTFHQASGIMSLGPEVDRAQFGNQDPDVYFYGDTIEKLSNRQYKITRGGFTTCVQPTPRWEVTSGSVTINLDEYAIARNTVLRVKGVPLMYLPVVYYPIQDDERATGFLMPTWGASTVRGQAISNAFFWAWDAARTRPSSTTGSRAPARGWAASTGTCRISPRPAISASIASHNSETNTHRAARRASSPRARASGSLAQWCRPSAAPCRARARVDYFSDITSEQLYQQNVHYATRSTREIDGGISAGVGAVSTSAQYHAARGLQRRHPLDGRRQHAAPHRRNCAAAAVRPAVLWLAQQRIRVPALSHGQQRHHHHRQQSRPDQSRTGAPRPAVAADLSLPHADGDQPDDLLHTQPRRRGPTGIRFARAPVAHGADRRDRAGVQQDLGHAGQHVHRADEARHRAGVRGRLRHRNREPGPRAAALRHLGLRRRRSGKLHYGLTNRFFYRSRPGRRHQLGPRANSSRWACSRPITPIPCRAATTRHTRPPAAGQTTWTCRPWP